MRNSEKSRADAETKYFLRDREKILIRKQGMEISILSRFNREKNIFMRFREGNHLCHFLSPDVPFEGCMSGERFHTGWDDFAPYSFGSYGIIGANHGSSFAYRISMLRHWLSESDIGRELLDDAGHRFVIVDIENHSDYIIHSQYEKNGDRITFSKISGSLYLDGFRVEGKIEPTLLCQRNSRQFGTHQRYRRMELFDEKDIPMTENAVTECASATLLWDIDLCPPDSLLDCIAACPGRYFSPAGPELAPLLNNSLRIVFQPGCAYTVDSQITILQDREDTMRYGLLQSYSETRPAIQEKFIPGLKTFTAQDAEGNSCRVDLSRVYLFPKGGVRKEITKSCCRDARSLPNEYIDFFGVEGKKLWAAVLGYSIRCGITRRGAEEERGDMLCHLYNSGKIYPYVLQCRQLRKGDTYRIFAWRQFLDPEQGCALSSYGHWEEGIYCHYCNYLSACDDILQLPHTLVGGIIEIMENSCGAQLPKKVPENGAAVVRVGREGALVFSVQ